MSYGGRQLFRLSVSVKISFHRRSEDANLDYQFNSVVNLLESGPDSSGGLKLDML